MKYIPKKYQKFLEEQDLQTYKSLLKKRLYLYKQIKIFVEKEKSKDYYLKHEWKSLRSKIDKIEKNIKDIEFSAFEKAETILCKEGNVLVLKKDKEEKWKKIVTGRKNRDYYNVFDLDLKIEREFFWKDIVTYFNLSKISKQENYE